MKHFAKLAALATLVATAASAQQYAPPPPPPSQGYGQPPPQQPPPQQQLGAPDEGEPEVAPPPPTAMPDNAPPPPPANVPPAVSAPAAQPLPPPPPRQGEWVYTAQYGWIWAPYGRRYTYVVDASDTASMYVYYPRFGWRWVAAPWVLGFGPVPRWGPRGPVRFVWYSHPWFRPRRVIVGRRRVVVRRHW
jgi:hypothetical protein